MIKKLYSLLMSLVLIVSLCACSQQVPKEEMEEMTSVSNGEYLAIVWNENTYVPYCAISKSDCGKQIGIVNGDEDNRVYEYNGYSTDEWITHMYVSGLMDSPMLFREINAADIPEGLQSEWCCKFVTHNQFPPFHRYQSKNVDI